MPEHRRIPGSPFRWYDRLRVVGDQSLDAAQQDVHDRWPLYVAASAGIGVLGASGLQVLGTSRYHVAQFLFLLLGVSATVLGLLTLIWGVFATHSRRTGPRAYLIVSYCSVATGFVTVVTAAGLTRMALAASGGTVPGLWELDQYYAWELLEAIPIIHPEENLGWSRPPLHSELVSLVALILKIVLLIPLAQFVTSGYWWWRDKRIEDRVNRSPEAVARRTTVGSSDLSYRLVAAFGVTVLVVALTLAGLAWVWRDGSTVETALVALPTALDVPWPASFTTWEGWTTLAVPLTWVVPTLKAITLILVLYFFGVAVLAFAGAVGDQPASIMHLAVVILGMLVALALGGVLLAASIDVVVQLELATATPAFPPGSSFGAAWMTQLWNLADEVPALDIPRSLDWPAPHRVSGILVGLLTIAYELLVLVAILVVPLMIGHASRRRRSAPIPPVRAAQEFCVRLASASTALQRAEQAAKDGGSKKEPRVYATAFREVQLLEIANQNVVSAFGPGSVAESADAATIAANSRLRNAPQKRHLLARLAGWIRRGSAPLAAPAPDTASLAQLGDTFARLARSELADAMPEGAV